MIKMTINKISAKKDEINKIKDLLLLRGIETQLDLDQLTYEMLITVSCILSQLEELAKYKGLVRRLDLHQITIKELNMEEPLFFLERAVAMYAKTNEALKLLNKLQQYGASISVKYTQDSQSMPGLELVHENIADLTSDRLKEYFSTVNKDVIAVFLQRHALDERLNFFTEYFKTLNIPIPKTDDSTLFLIKLINMIAELLNSALNSAIGKVSSSKHLKETKFIKQSALVLLTKIIKNTEKSDPERLQALRGFIMRASIPREGGWMCPKFGHTSSMNEFKNAVLYAGNVPGISKDDFNRIQLEAEEFYLHPDKEIAEMQQIVNSFKDKHSSSCFFSSMKQHDKPNFVSRLAEEYLNNVIAAKFSGNKGLYNMYKSVFLMKCNDLYHSRVSEDIARLWYSSS